MRQDYLTFLCGNRRVKIPKKELYGYGDFALVIDKPVGPVRSSVNRASKQDPSIKPQRKKMPTANGNGSAIQTVFNEGDFIKIVTGLLTPKNGHKESSLDLPNGTRLDGLSETEKILLQFLIARTNKGKTASREEIKKKLKDLLSENSITDRKIHTLIHNGRSALVNTNYSIIRKFAKGTKAGYVFTEHIAEEDQQKTEEPSKPESSKELTPQEQRALGVVRGTILEILSNMAENIPQRSTNLALVL